MQRYFLLSFAVGLVFMSLGYFFRFHLQDALSPPPHQFDGNFQARLESRLAADHYGDLHSYVVWHKDGIVFEWYGEGYTADTLHPIHSVTKSVTSAALGVTTETTPLDLQMTLPELFPDYAELIGQDQEKAKITLEDLLTMRGGFAWDEISTAPFTLDNGITKILNSPDWLETVLKSDMAHEPGAQFTYNSGGSVLVAEVASRRAGRPMDELVAERIFAPLGIADWAWEQGANGVTSGGWGLDLRPRDMLLFGRLFLENGRWQGEQIVPADWVATSTQTHVTETTWGLPYGYHWWRFSDSAEVVQGLEVNDVFWANGYGGQAILVVPHLDLVVVVTAADGNDVGRMYPSLSHYVFPAAQR